MAQENLSEEQYRELGKELGGEIFVWLADNLKGRCNTQQVSMILGVAFCYVLAVGFKDWTEETGKGKT